MTSPSDPREEPVRLLDLDAGLEPEMSADAYGLLAAGRDCDPSDEEVESLTAKLAPLVTPVAAAAAVTVVTGIALTEAAKGGTSLAAWIKSLLVSKWIVTSTIVAGTTATAVAVTQIELDEPNASDTPTAVQIAAPARPKAAIRAELAPAVEPLPSEVVAEPVAVVVPQLEQDRVFRRAPSKSALRTPSTTPLAPEAGLRAPTAPPPTAAFPAVIPAVPDGPDVRGEGELLSRAFAALQGGDAAGALRLTREHQALTGTALSQERERIAIEALVQLGQRSAAQARAVVFAQRFPNSTYLPRIQALFRDD